MSTGQRRFQGIAAAPGIRMGRAVTVHRKYDSVDRRELEEHEVESELARFDRAVQEALHDLSMVQQRIAADMGEDTAHIFRAHQAVLEDPEVVDVTKARIRKERQNAEYLFNDVMHGWITHLSAIQNPFFRERTADFEDIRHRVLEKLSGVTGPGRESFSESVILVAHALSPSDTADIDRRWVCGFVTDVGGPTSHTAIVARGLGLPAVVGVSDAARQIPDGTLLIIDGNTGTVYADPDSDTLRRFEEAQARLSVYETELRTLVHLPAVTPDGHNVELGANIELPEEVESALRHGVDGIGLYRTEFQFLLDHALPTEEEQYKHYRTIAQKMAPRPVIIRTLDLGADKLPALETPEDNPALGFRGIRLCLGRPEMFKTQLRAILRASVEGNLRIMFPMISGLEELRQAMTVIRELQEDLDREETAYDRGIPIGIMIEVPSAALTASDLAQEVDFFSIGTNDLIQYTVAVDRGNAQVSSLYDPFHPAVLHLISGVVKAAHEKKIWVGVCGAMAGDPVSACVLLGLGVDELSMSAIDIPSIKKFVRSTSYADMQDIARAVAKLPTSNAIREYLRSRGLA
ncbi:MAG: phosphoenolpyruvate--protein phosphotransferase [candidate division Zixibacteria bacterium]|nr:phosphoenolpyruvate--protein phosphotransferase [candidate division Zixibacteria bacterium]